MHLLRGTQPKTQLHESFSEQEANRQRLATNDATVTFLMGIAVIVMMSFCNSAAGLSTEILIQKRNDGVPLWKKNAYLYQWGVILNVLFLLVPSLDSVSGLLSGSGNLFSGSSTSASLSIFSNPDNILDPAYIYENLFHGFTLATWFHLLFMAIKGISVALVISYFQNGALVKCITKVLVVYCVSILMFFIYGTQLENTFIVGTLIFTYGGWLYFVPADASVFMKMVGMKMKSMTQRKVKAS